MIVLLECLKRREYWAEQFIEGLEACEQSTLAAEMRAEYRALTTLNSTGKLNIIYPDLGVGVFRKFLHLV